MKLKASMYASVSCYFAGEVFVLFSLWPAEKLQAYKIQYYMTVLYNNRV